MRGKYFDAWISSIFCWMQNYNIFQNNLLLFFLWFCFCLWKKNKKTTISKSESRFQPEINIELVSGESSLEPIPSVPRGVLMDAVKAGLRLVFAVTGQVEGEDAQSRRRLWCWSRDLEVLRGKQGGGGRKCKIFLKVHASEPANALNSSTRSRIDATFIAFLNCWPIAQEKAIISSDSAAKYGVAKKHRAEQVKVFAININLFLFSLLDGLGQKYSLGIVQIGEKLM